MNSENLKIQDYFSLGYLYLLVLGILRDTIYYSFLGLNIMEFSNVLDVLLSPVVYFAGRSSAVVFLVVLIIVLIPKPKLHLKLREYKWYSKLFDVKKRDEQYAQKKGAKVIISLMAIAVACFFLGTGIGAGIKMSERISAKTLSATDVVVFADGDEQEVAIINQNSSYVFYILKDTDYISVSPINGVIKRIEIGSLTHQ
jgi:hypothetical protein